MESVIHSLQDHIPFAADNSSLANMSPIDLHQQMLAKDINAFLRSTLIYVGFLVAFFILAKIITPKQKLPVGVKRLPRLPGAYSLRDTVRCHIY
jgi:hypothetical protein